MAVPSFVDMGSLTVVSRQSSVVRRVRMLRPSPFALLSSLLTPRRLQPAQNNPNDRRNVLIVRQPILRERGQDQLCRNLWQNHPDERAGARSRVVRPKSPQFDLVTQIVLQERQDAIESLLHHEVGNLRP